ncbi:MAG: alpha/beta fold hydrolase [Kofleriaceae bacterium]|nr:alpha/beta fold hydrolase [Kofleriaceae bacterium]
MTAWTRVRTELEVAFGGLQLKAMRRAVATAAGLRAQSTPDGVVYAHRPTKRGLPYACIHGFGGDKETWLLLSALVPRSRGIVAVDLPGHGASTDVPEKRASIRHHAEAVLRCLDHAGVDRAIVCGNSMGGGVALRLAASYPDRVAGLVLVASIGRDIHDGPARTWIGRDNPLIPRLEDVDKFMAIVLEQPPPVGKAVLRHVITERARRADTLHKLFRGFVLADEDAGVPREIGGIVQQALVIHGEQDRIISKAVGEDLVHALPRAEMVVMRGVGHAPQLEAPRYTARIIERFARRIEGRR